MNPQTVSTAFKTALANWSVANGVQVYDYVPDSQNPPCVCVYPEAIPYDFSANCTWILWLLSGKVEEQGAQARMLGWIADTGPTSIIAALDANHSLTGTVSSTLPLELRGYGAAPVTAGGTPYMQARLVYHVLR